MGILQLWDRTVFEFHLVDALQDEGKVLGCVSHSSGWRMAV